MPRKSPRLQAGARSPKGAQPETGAKRALGARGPSSEGKARRGGPAAGSRGRGHADERSRGSGELASTSSGEDDSDLEALRQVLQQVTRLANLPRFFKELPRVSTLPALSLGV